MTEPDPRDSCQARRGGRGQHREDPCGRHTELGLLGLGICLDHWKEYCVLDERFGQDQARVALLGPRAALLGRSGENG